MNLKARFQTWLSSFSVNNFKRVKSGKFWWQLIKTNRKKIFWSIGIIFLILLAIPLFTYIYFAGDLKDKESITNRNRTGLTLLDDQGKPFFTFYHAKSVSYIPISEMPEHLQQAVIAAEDKDFYNNLGFSITGMGRAFLRNLMAGEIVEGGSTISQELIKIALLDSDRNVLRKYQEIVLATELNRRFSKQDILEMYLNSVYFGEGAFGIENAAQAYFGIHAKDLNLAQSALLVGLLPAPSAYSPLSNDPDRSLRRQRIVLSQMVAANIITKDQETQALNTPLDYDPIPQAVSNILAPHFALYVKALLEDKYGEEFVIREGFKVKTTLNSTWQKYAEQVAKTRIQNLQRNNATNAAIVAIDPQTGDIKVMVGSHDWSDENNGRVNMAVHPRQPGSSFKPIVYADALEQKLITPATILHDKPIKYGDYEPLNYDKRFRGDISVRRALANSLNVPAVEVMDMVGVESALSLAKKMGITTLTESPQYYGLPVALGSGEVKLLELTNAYAVFADQGVYHTPNAILEIRDKYDRVVTDQPKNNFFSLFNIFSMIPTLPTNQEKKVLSDETAFLISSILSDNQARADVFGSALTISRPAAVKTGTTNDYKDALTVGYTPSLVIGVWVGNNDNTPMDNIAGSFGAAPIWRLLMENFLQGTRLEPFIQPASIIRLAPCLTPNTIATSTAEYFIKGTEPDCPTPTPTPSATPNPTDSPTPTTTPVPTNTPSPTGLPTETPTPTSLLPTLPLTP